MKNIKPVLVLAILVSLFSSCAAAGNIISASAWIGLLDLAVAAGITLYILRGKNN